MRFFLIFICLIFFNVFAGYAQQTQENETFTWDIDTIFDTPFDNTQEEPVTPTQTTSTVISRLRRRSFTFTNVYNFNIGIAPGWYDQPFSSNWDSGSYYLDRFIRMRDTFRIDAQVSDSLRVLSNLYFEIPSRTNINIQLGDFFFDYIFYEKVFFRGGKYEMQWGISPNYSYTNLLARIPNNGAEGPSYIFKADVPIRNGGLQALTLTRVNLLGSNSTQLPKKEDFGFGVKYNLALRSADFNLGLYYMHDMPVRSFLSIKTTRWNTEFYNEWLLSVDTNYDNQISGSVNIGFDRELIKDKLFLNGEIFFNGEENILWYDKETNIKEASISSFPEDLNLALNLLYKPWEKGNPRIYLGILYAPMQNSAQIIPGFRYNPWGNVSLSLSTPISLGNPDGFYYNNTFTINDRKTPLPFAVIFMISINGSIQFRQDL